MYHSLLLKKSDFAIKKIKKRNRVSALAQWVKNLIALTAAAWVATKEQVWSLAWYSGLKDLALPQMGLRFNPWPWKLHMIQVRSLKKSHDLRGVILYTIIVFISHSLLLLWFSLFFFFFFFFWLCTHHVEVPSPEIQLPQQQQSQPLW